MYDKVEAGQSTSYASQTPNTSRKRPAGSRSSSPVLLRKEEVKEETPEPELDEVRGWTAATAVLQHEGRGYAF